MMLHRFLILLLAAAAPVAASASARAGTPPQEVWQPAATPRGGVSWAVLEATRERTRTDSEGYLLSRPIFTPQVRALEGKRITVAGYMMPLENGSRQSHFVLLAYPPGCPFHLHAAPNQFIEVRASRPFALNETDRLVVTGVLHLTGQNEEGIFYQLTDARPA